jgi:hypothetical protein
MSETRYEIRLQGHLADHWAGWFEGMSLTREGDGTTLLHGHVVDQAALHGLLSKVRDTGLPLVSLASVATAPKIAEHPTQQGETR